MDIFIKAALAVLVTSVLCIVISKQSKDISTVLVLCVSCMILIAAVTYMKPVIELVLRLQTYSQMNNQMLSVLLKTTGIGLLTEITTLVCSDSGNSVLGKALQILSCSVILWLSVPMMNELIDLVENIMGNI